MSLQTSDRLESIGLHHIMEIKNISIVLEGFGLHNARVRKKFVQKKGHDSGR